MNLLIVGGSGYVGALVLPILATAHRIRVLDPKPPPEGPWEYIQGDIADRTALRSAVEDIDALVFMAKGSTDHDGKFTSTTAVQSAFDVSVRGLYLTLETAACAGCLHAVYTSSMSVFDGPVGQRFFADENLEIDTRDVYGLTKYLGEEVCAHAVRAWSMTVNVLRLCLPVSMSEWERLREDKSNVYTSSEDLGSAVLAALAYRSGFEVFMIGGDANRRSLNLSKAKRLLHWEPRTEAKTSSRLTSAARNILRRVH